MKNNVLARVSLIATIALTLAGCSSTPAAPTTDPLAGVKAAEVSAAQAAEIEDGVATADEYQAAFQRYRDCLSAAGFELAKVEFTNLVYTFGVPNAAVEDGADAKCYSSEFKYSDILWQTSDGVQDSSETARVVRECLHEQGIDPAGTLDEMNEQLREAGIELPECLA